MKYEGLVESLDIDSALEGTDRYTYIGSFYDKNVSSRASVFHCRVCAEDEVLFGNALFWTRKRDFLRGQLFCGCAKKIRWTKSQAEIKSERACEESGTVFRGIIEPYVGAQGRCNLFCGVCNHEWTSNLSNLWTLKRGCPSCRNMKFIAAGNMGVRKPDEIVVKAFMDTGFYPEGTNFTRIDRKARSNLNNYWRVYCPLCDSTSEAQQGHIFRGNVRCDCSRLNQKEGYILFLKEGDDVVFLKFGISKDSYKRLITHQYNTKYTVEIFAVFKYESSADCKAAERECLDDLVCGVVDKEMMTSGWTETTYTYNLDKILSIFSKHRGIRIL